MTFSVTNSLCITASKTFPGKPRGNEPAAFLLLHRWLEVSVNLPPQKKLWVEFLRFIRPFPHRRVVTVPATVYPRLGIFSGIGSCDRWLDTLSSLGGSQSDSRPSNLPRKARANDEGTHRLAVRARGEPMAQTMGRCRTALQNGGIDRAAVLARIFSLPLSHFCIGCGQIEESEDLLA